MKRELKGLSDPTKFQGPISLSNLNPSLLKEMLLSMILIRKTEHRLALGRKDGHIGGPVHLGAGQEAIAVGVSSSLRSTDRVFGAHRSHAHLLALNPDFYRLFAEILGKDTGFSKGMGGSMHLFDQDSGFYGSVPIVSGTVPLAVGAAMASRMQNKEDIGVVYIGDGAVEEGVVHESFNLAKVQNAPVLFVIENNLFASHMHISLRQPSPNISRFAKANCVPYKLLDGNNVADILLSSKELINNCRENKGPALIEAVTYRWLGHVDWREDIDVGINRCEKTLQLWKEKCPLKRLKNSILKENILTKDNFDLVKKIKNKFKEIVLSQ